MLQKKFQNLDSCIDDSREPELCSIADIVKGRHRKKQKIANAKPIAFMRFNTKKGKPKPKTLIALLDSGASDSIVTKKHVTKLKIKKASQANNTWSTPGGQLTTTGTVNTQFTLRTRIP